MRLWISLGVPAALCDEYAKRAKDWKGLGHAWVVGYADPTHCIPEGMIFVTGTISDDGENLLGGTSHVFATRSPCLKPNDARLLPLLTQRPRAMTQEQWDQLIKLPFGAVMFPDAEEGILPLAALLADGDVDGDLYFLCWHHKILSALRAGRKMAPVVAMLDEMKKTQVRSPCHDFLSWYIGVYHTNFTCHTSSLERAFLDENAALTCTELY